MRAFPALCSRSRILSVHEDESLSPARRRGPFYSGGGTDHIEVEIKLWALRLEQTQLQPPCSGKSRHRYGVGTALEPRAVLSRLPPLVTVRAYRARREVDQ